MDKNKENKERNITNRSKNTNGMMMLPPPAQYGLVAESVFNSTAKNIADDLLATKETDLSTISSIYSSDQFSDLFLTPQVVSAQSMGSVAAGAVRCHEDTIVNTSDLLSKQTELDVVYMQYLMIMNMKENVKKCFREDEEIAMRDMFELHKATEALKKEYAEIEAEEKLMANLSELVTFIASFTNWMDENSSKLDEFAENYQRLCHLCSEAKNFMSIKNISIGDKVELERTLAKEIKNTTNIIDRINGCFEARHVASAPDAQSDEKIKYKFLEDLMGQYEQLKHVILKFSNLS